MIARSPRFVLTSALLALAAVLGLFAAGMLDKRGDERRDAERRFTERARVAAALTQSVFASQAPQAALDHTRRFGGERPAPAALERLVKRSRLAYAVLLDARGGRLAASPGTPPAALQRLARGTDHVRRVAEGEPYRLAGYVRDGSILEYASAFPADDGERRVLVQGYPASLISDFLGDYLAGLPGGVGSRAYVVDSADRVIAAAAEGQRPGEVVRDGRLAGALRGSAQDGRFRLDGADQRFAARPVGGSDWRVVLAQPAATLFAGTGHSLELLILVVLALVGLGAVVLLHRAASSALRLREAHARVTAGHEELERANAELRRSNGELEQFASVASHDLQEPLRKVQAFGEQIERRFGADLPDEAADYLRRMRRAAARMSTLIEDLLQFSRVTTHARPAQAVDLQQIAREVTADLDALVQDAAGRVEIGALPRVEADPLQMRQLLQNLIGNALKFRRPDVPAVVRVLPLPAGDPRMAAFVVSDNGVGFAPEHAERIFRVFERLHARDAYPGTGIGLAVCRKIAERHGGSITAEPAPGGGARFTVVLPRAPSPGGAGRPAGEREPAHA